MKKETTLILLALSAIATFNAQFLAVQTQSTAITHALDRTFNLLPVINWVTQMTNPAGASGVLAFNNTRNPTQNNFWRVRSVP